MSAEPRHLALNVYRPGRAAQDRLLAECLAPAARALLDGGALDRFWYQRFDARGPHLFVLLSGTGAGLARARARLDADLAAWLAADPSTEAASDDELRALHAALRGKVLCALDAEPGFAPPDTWAWAPQPDDGYPMRLFAGTPDPEGLWRALTEVTLWSTTRLAGAADAAVRWIAAVDHALRRHGAPADAYWRHHAATLLTGMDERLREDEARVLAALPGVVGERNGRTFARIWAQVEADAAAWAPVDALVGRVLAPDARTDASRRVLLRELNHSVLSQLGQPVRLHVPLVVYGWLRGLPAPAAAA